MVTLAVATLRPTNTRRSTTPPPIIRLSQVSSLVSAGFTTTVPVNFLPVRRFPLLTPIRWINRCPDQPDEYLQTGKRCSTSRSNAYSAASTLWISATTAAPSPTAAATRLVDPDLTSPIAKTPIRLVSSGNAGRPAREVEFAPVTTKFFQFFCPDSRLSCSFDNYCKCKYVNVPIHTKKSGISHQSRSKNVT